jgi:hemerythrin superfamily protein
VTSPTTQQDVIDILVSDHREVEELFIELETGLVDGEERRRVTDVVIAELVRHAVAEEAYVYPAARRALPDGDKIAEHEISEHADAERTMKDLEDLKVEEPEFDAKLSHLISTIRHHVQDEETDLFPRLRQACSAEELQELGRKVETIKKFAPTRPHPSAPDHPPLNKLLGPGAGLVDRLRDALSKRPTSVDEL